MQFPAKMLVYVLCLVLSVTPAFAQWTSATKQTAGSKRIPLPDSTVEKKLIELAMSNPSIESAEHQNKINEYQLKSAKNNWLNLLSLSANYNDQSFKKQDPTAPYVYPKFYTGINIPLGTLFSRTGVKAAKEQVAISRDNRELLRRSIQADILSKYKQFRFSGELIVNQQAVVDDYQAAFLQDEKKFSDGTITIDIYNTASKNYNDERAKLLNLQLQQEIIRIDIERVIGVPLDSILYSSM